MGDGLGDGLALGDGEGDVEGDGEGDGLQLSIIMYARIEAKIIMNRRKSKALLLDISVSLGNYVVFHL